MRSWLAFSLVSALLITQGACGPTYVRGSQDPSIDNPAMSTGLDKDDIQRMLSENLNNMRSAPMMDIWRSHRSQDTVAIFPFQNDTTEHLEPQLQAILGEAETWLVEANVVTMVSRERQNQMVAEVEGQQHPVFNHAHVAQYGRQLGVKYFITGKVSANDERSDSARRVQYTFFMQIIEVETGVIRWQHKSYVTKAAKS
jgi:PBP1b-binding outer membrane lipoprotein LpoB